ncbi:hypothetical protein BDU57DRAFT_74724 [Ampelomyces quisqualis]|uniref:Uncharacterized protein n=1 Tax=Ampelomyces quisqualis TaxID=50730 RepID=A0A6A5Q8D7_AMPQU|nr:hypothetical protein BDU57DRAFT_74724 [Ampelomyces quisqualis]
MVGLRGGADIRSEADMDAELEAALTALPANLDDASSDEIPAWIVYDVRSKSAPPYYILPRLAQPDFEPWTRRRARSQPILRSEQLRTPLHATQANTSNSSSSDGLMISPRKPSPGQPCPINASLVEEWLNEQSAQTQSTSPPPVPADVASVPSPEVEGEELTPQESDMLNAKFQGMLRGGGASCDQYIRTRIKNRASVLLRRVQEWLVHCLRRVRSEALGMETLGSSHYATHVDGTIHSRPGDLQHGHDNQSSLYQMPLSSHSALWATPNTWSAWLQPRPSLSHTIIPGITLTPPTPRRRAHKVRRVEP